MTREFLTISNLLSLSRIPLAALFAVFMFINTPAAEWWALAVLLLGVLTDKLDGDLARRLGQESSWGRILDPLADKIGVAVVAIVLLVRALIPLWFVAVLVGRDLVILAGGLVLQRRTGAVMPSNWAGKWTVGFIAVTLILGLLRAPLTLQLVAQLLTTGMVTLSLVLYARAYLNARTPKEDVR